MNARYRWIRTARIGLAAAALPFLSPAASPAAGPLQAGEVLVAAVDAGGVIYRVDPTTGRETVLGSLGRLVRDVALTVDERGRIVIVSADAGGTSGGVMWMEPTNGRQHFICSGRFLVDPVGVALDERGDILVTDAEAFDGAGGLIRVQPDSGDQRPVSPGGYLRHPMGISAKGDLMVAVPAAPGGPAIVRVDPLSGEQTRISAVGSLRAPVGVTVTPQGDLLVADAKAFDGYGWVLRVDRVTGTQTKLCSGGRFVEPQGLALGAGGDLFVVDRGAFGGKGGVIRAKASTGAEVAGWPGATFNDPRSIAIVPGSQPDAMMNKGFLFGYAGKGRYNDDGAGQARTQNAHVGETRSFVIRVQNSGRLADSFVVEGAPSTAGFSVQYFDDAKKGHDITADVLGGAYVLKNLAPNATRYVRAEITAESQSSVGQESFLITTRSAADPTKRDAVRAVVMVRP